jgi:septum formation protein
MSKERSALVLGSASPRRAELLAQLGVGFSVQSADINEAPLPNEDPRDYVRRMALEKSAALLPPHKLQAQAQAQAQALLTADTTVVLDNQSLGKPRDRSEAQRMLTALSGRSHAVYTAVCLQLGGQVTELLVATTVEFARLSGSLIDAYLETDEPWDKAGAYAIQGLAGSFVRHIDGSVSNVIGLPLVETRELLDTAGIVTGIVGAGA